MMHALVPGYNDKHGVVPVIGYRDCRSDVDKFLFFIGFEKPSKVLGIIILLSYKYNATATIRLTIGFILIQPRLLTLYVSGQGQGCSCSLEPPPLCVHTWVQLNVVKRSTGFLVCISDMTIILHHIILDKDKERVSVTCIQQGGVPVPAQDAVIVSGSHTLIYFQDCN